MEIRTAALALRLQLMVEAPSLLQARLEASGFALCVLGGKLRIPQAPGDVVENLEALLNQPRKFLAISEAFAGDEYVNGRGVRERAVVRRGPGCDPLADFGPQGKVQVQFLFRWVG